MPSRVHLFWFVIPTLALSLRGQTLPKDSPFLAPPNDTAPAHVDSAAGYQLSGMTVVGTETLLSITRENDQRSQWIAVGQTLGEISVVSYDAAKDQAVIRVGEKEHTLTLRKPSIAAATVSPLIPPNPAAAGISIQSSPTVAVESAAITMPPLTPQEEKEMEARMLVTDLLEIGQRQRKAYAEAKREAARKAAEAARAAEEAAAAAKK